MARRGGKNKTGRKQGDGKSKSVAQQQDASSSQTRNATKSSSSSSQKKNPLIAFVGQLSFETTRDDLMEHIRTQLKDTRHKVSNQTIQIRMLTDPKTKSFRGMAFVEVVQDDPEFLYALLKLHQTYLKGRRINVERSAGGRKNSESRRSKLEQYKKDQEAYFAKVVDNILQEFQATGEIRKDELDEGVLTLCRRHAGPVVKAAVTEYVEKSGRDMENPSAYLTFLVAKFAKEGIHDEEATGKTKKKNSNNSNNSHGEPQHASGSSSSSRKRKMDPSSNAGRNDKNKRGKEWKESSDLAKSGVDMSMSERKGDGKSRRSSSSISSSGILSPTKDLSKIFPSSQRGRGRGYMRTVR